MSSGATWSGTLPGMGYELVEGVPHGFEAGTPDTEGTSAWERLSTSLEGGGIDVGLEHSLPQGRELAGSLRTVRGLRVYLGCPGDRIGIAAFVLDGIAADEVAEILSSRFNIMTRSGHHCTEPLGRHLRQPAMTRVSLYLYNTSGEIRHITDVPKPLARDRGVAIGTSR